MRKATGSDSKFKKYHKIHKDTVRLSNYTSSGRDYALKVGNIILGKNSALDTTDNENNKAVNAITKLLANITMDTWTYIKCGRVDKKELLFF